MFDIRLLFPKKQFSFDSKGCVFTGSPRQILKASGEDPGRGYSEKIYSSLKREAGGVSAVNSNTHQTPLVERLSSQHSIVDLLLRGINIQPCIFINLVIVFFFTGCQNRYENEATRDLSQTERVRYQQYMVQGQQLYRTHCSNCHQEEGTGLGRLIPPLAQSDYLLADVDRTLCLIKHGLQGEIIVNGQSYEQPMPANETLRDLEIAQIATYIYNHWGHAKGYIPTKRVAETLRQCADTPAKVSGNP